ncbi:MAG TPA: bifunctional 4-hydroxy-2-oxoglutarate aldolase/2-dehydro-3-deoxy-phosphogluconate aldolase [Thermoanaerobaculaceae bacterium]|nr:bifunctional 4-hydroxy-2-oxoglutarate aldolase/2-dehydro-3-deoxy-phosphogluconate aldolase [Thermoanaerobaculaceae bacterium]HPS76625.1 bifunctional 4-hydroxy-2-oxoglutarate aldolase/2-dehydro-3-deoxy-phosphogluconate aldolase [Thermoanaerobaculaceae bacterium]
MRRQEAVERIERLGLVPVVRAPSALLARRAAFAVMAGGIDVLEITMTVPDALEVLRQLVADLGDRALVGAGTVLDADTARACIAAGARFIVAPGLDLETVRAAQALDTAVMPGALTPTEVMAAWKAGADMVKIFPCSAVGGPEYVRALKAPFPRVKLLPTGGVDRQMAADYIRAGASALGVGTALVDVRVMQSQGDEVLSARARELVELVGATRAQLEGR